MSKRFFLNEDCFLVKGAQRGAIYNLKTGEIFSVNEDAYRLIDLCESGTNIEGLPEVVSKEKNDEVLQYFKHLEENGLGKFLENGQVIRKIEIKEPDSVLDFIWLEVSEDCNLRCIHCYHDDDSASNPSISDNRRMFFDDWKRLIDEAYQIGCRMLQFIGGEPLLANNLSEMILYSRQRGYKFVEVFTNCTLITDEQIDFLKENNVAVATSFYGPTAKIHETITKIAGSFEKTAMAIKKLKEKEVPLRVAVIATSINQDYVDETISFLRNDLGIDNVRYDLVRPSGRGTKEELVPQKLLPSRVLTKANFSLCSLETLQLAKFRHNCFGKNICITVNGSVIPCIMERDITLGNILDQTLLEILTKEKTKRIRGISKDFVEVCKDCEYRYACFDCRPKAKGASGGNLYAKPTECLYDPYTGKWAKKEEIENVRT